jgi:hypothetical protein
MAGCRMPTLQNSGSGLGCQVRRRTRHDRLQMRIGADGTVQEAHLVSGPRQLVAAAHLAAVKQWRHLPVVIAAYLYTNNNSVGRYPAILHSPRHRPFNFIFPAKGFKPKTRAIEFPRNPPNLSANSSQEVLNKASNSQ